jgi:hypothetical protein
MRFALENGITVSVSTIALMSITDRRTERHRARKDDHGDDQADDRVKVVLEFPLREPNDQAGSDDPNIAKGVAHDMKNQSTHIHVAMRMPVPMPVPMFMLVLIMDFKIQRSARG